MQLLPMQLSHAPAGQGPADAVWVKRRNVGRCGLHPQLMQENVGFLEKSEEQFVGANPRVGAFLAPDAQPEVTYIEITNRFFFCCR